MKLSKNFTLDEMIRTSTGIPNIPTDKEIENIKMLVENVLQPLRDHMNRPIIVNSGFRSKEVNKAVGGSKTSGHMLGTAADITMGSKALNRLVYNYIRDNLVYRQLINEYNYS